MRAGRSPWAAHLERRIVPLDGGHGVVHGPAYGGLVGVRLQLRPAGFARHQKMLWRGTRRVFGISALVDLRLELRVGLLEGVGDVLEEDQAQDDVLVLGGVHAAPQRVGHPPQLGPVVRNAAVVAAFCPASASPRGRHRRSPNGLGIQPDLCVLSVPHDRLAHRRRHVSGAGIRRA